MTTDLATRDGGTTAALFAGATPADVLAAATEAADVLADVIKQRKLFKRIGDRDHVLIQGWQTLGALVGVFAQKDTGLTRLTWPKLAAVGDEPDPAGPEPRNRNTSAWQQWKATANKHDRWQHTVDKHDARNAGLSYGFATAFFAVKDGQQVGWGEGRCDRSDRVWTNRDDYALASMAQTRAQSRALAAPLRFVVELAGYASTPAEDMPDDAPAGAPTPEPPPPIAMLDEEGEHELAAALQKTWPTIDAYGFLVLLMKQLQTEGVPEVAGRALKGWAWWQGRPEATGSIRAQDDADSEPEQAPAAPA